MRGQQYLAQLMRHPWAIEVSYMPLVSRVLSRLMAGEPMSAEDRERVEIGKAEWAARAKQSSGYAGDIAIVGVYGILSQRGEAADASTPTTSTAHLASVIRAAAADPSISAVILDVDSPGGTTLGIAEFADSIYQARGSKPIAAISNGLCASAAYWAASQAGELYAAPGALTGSIGVYLAYEDESEALKKQGVSVELISAGPNKTEASGLGPLTDEARAHLQGIVNGYYESFLRSVAQGRGTSMKAVRENMGGGRVLLPDAAQSAGMIDGTLTLTDLVAKLQARLKRSGASALARMQRETTIAELEG